LRRAGAETVAEAVTTAFDPPAEFVLAGGPVVAGDDLSLLETGYVVVREGRIAEVGEGVPRTGLPVVDTSRRLLMPGMLNCHTHLGDAVVKEKAFGFPAGTNLLWAPDGLRHGWMASFSRSAQVAAMRRAVQHLLATGTVAFADFREGGLEGVTAMREACEGLPVKAIIYARHAEAPIHSDAAFLDNREGLPQAQADEIVACLEVADGFSVVWANETTDPGLVQSAEIVRAAGKRLAAHACETPLYRNLSLERSGRGDVDRLLELVNPDFVVHMTEASDDEMERVVKAGVPVVFCPRGQAALGNGFSPFTLAQRKGALIGLGSDNAMINSPDLFAEMDFICRVSQAITHDPAVVDPRALLAAATIDAARVLQLDDELGSLSAGKAATLVALDLGSLNLVDSVDPVASLVTRAGAADIRAVLVDGRVVHGVL
jgi:cytosine/adenosine deaminase-related metal-dependent hydrolase